MDICLLCLEMRYSSDKGIQVESSQWRDENLEKIIEKHFWPLKTLTLKSWLCSNCWRILHEFHKFHAGIEKAHSCLSMVQNHKGIEKAHSCLSMVHVKTENSVIDECEDREFLNCDVFDPVNTPQLEQQKELYIPIVSTAENENVNKELDNERTDNEPKIIIPQISLSRVSNTTNDPLQKSPRALESSKTSSKRESRLNLNSEYFKCKTCGKVFENLRCLENHARLHVDVEHVCDVCGKVFFRQSVLKRHKFSHYDISCDICGLKLETKKSLSKHKNRMHPEGGQKEFKCHLCPKVCTNTYTLKSHIKYNHETGHDFKCTICEKAYKRARQLKEHMANHTGTELYICPHCPRTFTYNSSMNTHGRRAHPEMWEEAHRLRYTGELPPKLRIL